MPPPPPPPAPVVKAIPKAKGGGFCDEMKSTTEEAEVHIPARPKTPPDFGPEKFYDVTTEWVDAHTLFNRLQFGSQLLVIDVRSAADFEEQHIRSAINVDWAAVKADDMLEVEKQVGGRFPQRRMFSLVLYDESSSEKLMLLQVASQVQVNADRSCFQEVGPTLQAFIDGLIAERRASKTVTILNGGLADMRRSYAQMVKGLPDFMDAEFPSEILQGFLYLGSFACAVNRDALKSLGITHIINSTDNCDMPYPDDFKYIQCALDDSPKADIAQYFSASLDFMQEAHDQKTKVLVHCKMGMSRSPTIVIVWLMARLGMSLKEATDFCRVKRPYINPNPGFLKQLSKYEIELFKKTTIRFPEDGKPITVRTVYEWLQDDGTWVPRVTVTAPS